MWSWFVTWFDYKALERSRRSICNKESHNIGETFSWICICYSVSQSPLLDPYDWSNPKKIFCLFYVVYGGLLTGLYFRMNIGCFWSIYLVLRITESKRLILFRKLIQGDSSSWFFFSKLDFNIPSKVSRKFLPLCLSQCRSNYEVFFPFRMLCKKFNDVYYLFTIHVSSDYLKSFLTCAIGIVSLYCWIRHKANLESSR